MVKVYFGGKYEIVPEDDEKILAQMAIPESETDLFTGKRKHKPKISKPINKRGRDELQAYPGQNLIKKIHNSLNFRLTSMMMGYDNLGKIKGDVLNTQRI